MTAANKLPWPLLAIGIDECGPLFGVAGRTFLEQIACLPGFPARVRRCPAAWIAGEVVDWRDANRDRLARQNRRKVAA